MTAPRISIVTPSYNQAAFLENTIVSVLEQGYPDLEYFIMDGGSTDGSVEIIRKYANHLTYWESQPDDGQVAAINAGLRRATGEILAFLNSDDFLLQDALRNVAGAWVESPHAAGWVGGAHDVTRDGYILQTRTPQRLDRDELADWTENWVLQPGCFFSGEIARRVGFFNPAYHNAFDFDFWMRITAIASFVPIPSVIAAATIHPNTKTVKHMARMFEEVQAIQRFYGYAAFADRTTALIQQARGQTAAGTVARLLYMTGSAKRGNPDHFVRRPQMPNDA